MIRIKRSYFRSTALIVAVIVCGQQTWAQVQKAPGGINGASLWSANGDSSDFIGNYRSINLLKLKSQADTSIPPRTISWIISGIPLVAPPPTSPTTPRAVLPRSTTPRRPLLKTSFGTSSSSSRGLATSKGCTTTCTITAASAS